MRSMLLILLACIGIIYGLEIPSKENTLLPQSYLFDAGGANSEVGANAHLISPSDKYTESRGYGWVASNMEEFFHEDAKKSRSALLVDGVIGDTISFRADVPSRDWWLTVWFEAGIEDSATTELHINGKDARLNLQAFTPTAEPRARIQKIYRVVQRKVAVKNNTLTFSITGNQDKVRLLAISLIPDATYLQTTQVIPIREKLNQVVKYTSTAHFDSLLNDLDTLHGNSELQNFADYWKLQLHLIKKAEMYFQYRGWSWAIEKTGMGLFDHLQQSVMLYDGILNQDNAIQNPLYERALWYRGRLLYWLWLERGIYSERHGAIRDLAKMKQLHPEDELIRMYNGENIAIKGDFGNINKPKNAPEWAFKQWELTNRLKKTVDWWVNVQQSESGEFGGKFGDDVEILRWWAPLILSGDSVTAKGWKKLADGVWNSNKVYKGYAKKASDVEHSSEFISDTAPVMILFNDAQKYEDRLAYSAAYFRNLWTGYNDEGNRFFKSAWFSSSKVEMEKPKNRDVVYNARAVKAVRYYAWKSKHAATKKALIEWADSWYLASQLTDKGKPKGIIPPSIEFPSQIINGAEETWYMANMFWDYFDWKDGSAILDELLFTWTITDNEKYIQPIIQHLELLEKHKNALQNPRLSPKKGSEAWVAQALAQSKEFWNTIGNWRLLTSENKYDNLIIKFGSPYVKYRISGNQDYLVDELESYLQTVRYNQPMRAQEAIHTDRVFIRDDNKREAPVLLGMISGFAVQENSSPYIAASWENASRDLSYLVTDNDSSSINIEVYNFSESMQAPTLRLWQLKSGRYSLLQMANGAKKEQQIHIRGLGDRVILHIAPKTLTQISIKKAK